MNAAKTTVAVLFVVAFLGLFAWEIFWHSEDNPCEEAYLVGKVLMTKDRDDGTKVEVDHKPMVCEGGKAMPR